MSGKREVSYSMPIFLILILVIGWSLFVILKEDKEPEMIKVSVVVEESNSARWSVFRLGLETAAREENVDLHVVSTSIFADLDEELTLVDQALQSGSNGIILAPFNQDEDADYYASLPGNTCLCFVDSTVESAEGLDNIISAIPDYRTMADMIINQIKADYGARLEGTEVHLLSRKRYESGVATVLEQVGDSLRDIGCNVTDMTVSTDEQMTRLQDASGEYILVAFDDDSLLAAARVIASNSESETGLYGIGISEPNIYYLEKGVIKGMVVMDDFNLGYRSLQAVAQRVREKYGAYDSLSVACYSVRPMDVHNPEIERILFPDIQ